jgi:hypothetical protein
VFDLIMQGVVLFAVCLFVAFFVLLIVVRLLRVRQMIETSSLTDLSYGECQELVGKYCLSNKLV